jgi:hypothetical protein
MINAEPAEEEDLRTKKKLKRITNRRRAFSPLTKSTSTIVGGKTFTGGRETYKAETSMSMQSSTWPEQQKTTLNKKPTRIPART